MTQDNHMGPKKNSVQKSRPDPITALTPPHPAGYKKDRGLSEVVYHKSTVQGPVLYVLSAQLQRASTLIL